MTGHQIEPCPFCRSKSIMVIRHSENEYSVVCEKCKAQGQHIHAEDIAIETWNELGWIVQANEEYNAGKD